MIFCPLCLSKEKALKMVQGPDKREFRLCSNCKLIHTFPKYQLSEEHEKKRYEFHQNGIENTGYVKFLSKAIVPVLPSLNGNLKGLDYGCGHVPTLSKILIQLGINCDDYDPFFFPVILSKGYDFIFTTECFEHFFLPAKELDRLTKLLSDEGLLIIMTQRYKNVMQFKNWYYAKDPTHVSFFHTSSIDYICSKWKLKTLFNDGKSIIVLQKEPPVDTAI